MTTWNISFPIKCFIVSYSEIKQCNIHVYLHLKQLSWSFILRMYTAPPNYKNEHASNLHVQQPTVNLIMRNVKCLKDIVVGVYTHVQGSLFVRDLWPYFITYNQLLIANECLTWDILLQLLLIIALSDLFLTCNLIIWRCITI